MGRSMRRRSLVFTVRSSKKSQTRLTRFVRCCEQDKKGANVPQIAELQQIANNAFMC
jgi:hypothetical protein